MSTKSPGSLEVVEHAKGDVLATAEKFRAETAGTGSCPFWLEQATTLFIQTITGPGAATAIASEPAGAVPAAALMRFQVGLATAMLRVAESDTTGRALLATFHPLLEALSRYPLQVLDALRHDAQVEERDRYERLVREFADRERRIRELAGRGRFMRALAAKIVDAGAAAGLTLNREALGLDLLQRPLRDLVGQAIVKRDAGYGFVPAAKAGDGGIPLVGLIEALEGELVESQYRL